MNIPLSVSGAPKEEKYSFDLNGIWTLHLLLNVLLSISQGRKQRNIKKQKRGFFFSCWWDSQGMTSLLLFKPSCKARWEQAICSKVSNSLQGRSKDFLFASYGNFITFLEIMLRRKLLGFFPTWNYKKNWKLWVSSLLFSNQCVFFLFIV